MWCPRCYGPVACGVRDARVFDSSVLGIPGTRDTTGVSKGVVMREGARRTLYMENAIMAIMV